MYSCYVHGWSSHHSMCPACGQVVTTTGTIEVNKMTEFGPMTERELKLKFNASLFTHDECQAKLESALKMLEEMAGALEDYESCHVAGPGTARRMLDNYRKWKEGIK